MNNILHYIKSNRRRPPDSPLSETSAIPCVQCARAESSLAGVCLCWCASVTVVRIHIHFKNSENHHHMLRRSRKSVEMCVCVRVVPLSPGNAGVERAAGPAGTHRAARMPPQRSISMCVLATFSLSLNSVHMVMHVSIIEPTYHHSGPECPFQRYVECRLASGH